MESSWPRILHGSQTGIFHTWRTSRRNSEGLLLFQTLIHPPRLCPIPQHFQTLEVYSPWTLHTPGCIQLLLKGLCSVYCTAGWAATGGDRSLAQLSLFSAPSALQHCPLHPIPACWTATPVLALSWQLSTAAHSSAVDGQRHYERHQQCVRHSPKGTT